MIIPQDFPGVKTMFLPFILKNCHSSSDDVEDQDHSWYNVGLYRQMVNFDWKTGLRHNVVIKSQ